MEKFAAQIYNFIISSRPYSQIGMGVASGCLIGFILMKIGKVTAIAMGGAIILIKIAEIEGLIHINWSKIKQNVQHFPIKSPNNLTLGNTEEMSLNIQNFVISFVGGSLIGIGCS